MQPFFISGLGADKTVFQFLDLSYCNPVFIDWIPPQKKETLQHYAIRLKETLIPDNATIIGLSFGGMLATEIVKQYPSMNAIIISSAKTKDEIPAFYKAGKYLPMHDIFPGVAHKWLMMKMKNLFSIKDGAVLKVYKELIKNSDPCFNRWAVTALLNWNNQKVPENIFHLHGTHDKVLPYKYVKSDYTIKKGGHFMVMEQAAEISKILKEIITGANIDPLILSSSTNRFEGHFQE